MNSFYKTTPLRFDCTACGKCCTGSEDHYVAMTRGEAEKIRRHLDISPAWFARRYVMHLSRDMLTARMHGGRCAFLDRQGKCRVYALRPVQCRTYPYWPEVLASASSWRAEKKYCEGIDRGNVVPVSHIMQQLERQLAAEGEAG